eukprot:IDg4832t1
MSTQLGHICFLADKEGKFAPINFKSYKSKRIVRSAMSGEVMAFSDLFDRAATLAAEVISRTSEKRVMLDITAAREGFKDKVISDIGFVRSSHNLTYGLTKAMSQASLRDAVSNGHLNVVPEKWIIQK